MAQGNRNPQTQKWHHWFCPDCWPDPIWAVRGNQACRRRFVFSVCPDRLLHLSCGIYQWFKTKGRLCAGSGFPGISVYLFRHFRQDLKRSPSQVFLTNWFWIGFTRNPDGTAFTTQQTESRHYESTTVKGCCILFFWRYLFQKQLHVPAQNTDWADFFYWKTGKRNRSGNFQYHRKNWNPPLLPLLELALSQERSFLAILAIFPNLTAPESWWLLQAWCHCHTIRWIWSGPQCNEQTRITLSAESHFSVRPDRFL